MDFLSIQVFPGRVQIYGAPLVRYDMGLYICGSDEEYSSSLNVHKLGLSNFERSSLGTLAADTEFLD
jgi:hypothetical protein